MVPYQRRYCRSLLNFAPEAFVRAFPKLKSLIITPFTRRSLLKGRHKVLSWHECSQWFGATYSQWSVIHQIKGLPLQYYLCHETIVWLQKFRGGPDRHTFTLRVPLVRRHGRFWGLNCSIGRNIRGTSWIGEQERSRHKSDSNQTTICIRISCSLVQCGTTLI